VTAWNIVSNLVRLSLFLLVVWASIDLGFAQCVVPPSGLISWWPGEGNALDIQGSNHGTLQNGATFAPGLVGQAFSLDGVDDHILIQNSPSLNFGSTEVDPIVWTKFCLSLDGGAG
jgi:hypothetical protein